VVKGLLWLAFIGLVLFVATAVWGWLKRRANA
jgi:LPXTG-motif cell wall-anchored protein